MPDPEDIPADVVALWQALADPRPMRRGSIAERYVKCSKKGCPCNEQAELRHGPYYSLTRAVEGRTHSRLLGAEEAQVASRQIEAGRLFRKQLGAFWEACERWADREIESGASSQAAGKARSPRRARRKSWPKPQRS